MKQCGNCGRYFCMSDFCPRCGVALTDCDDVIHVSATKSKNQISEVKK